MERITFDVFIAHLRKYGSAVYCTQFRYFSPDSEPSYDIRYFYDRGCVIWSGRYEYEGREYIFYDIYQVSPDGEVDEVVESCKSSEEIKNYENPFVAVSLFCVTNGELPPEKDMYEGRRKYTRMGEKFSFDKRVRVLTPEDADQISSACAVSMENDTDFGIKLATLFLDNDFEFCSDKEKTYGFFDGETFCAVATCRLEEFNIAHLRNILVFPDYRGKGYGKALVLSALSEFPDKKWLYQVEKGNMESIALAKSLGFTLEGAELYVFNTDV